MIKWREAYERSSRTQNFKSYFGQLLPIDAFRLLVYSLQFPAVAAASVSGSFGAISGPTTQTFPSGAIILGITASAFQAQTIVGTFNYSPSNSEGRRDMFGISIQYTGDEQITPNGLVAADALLGSGIDTIFPGKEIMMPPSQGLSIAVASMAVLPTLSISVAFHAMVPRAAQ